MRWLEKLERRWGRFAVPNLTVAIILGQFLVFMLNNAQPGQLGRIELRPDKVFEGEVWRLMTFVCIPPTRNPIFAFFAWYLLYLMGSALEQTWGVFRYNLYLLIGYLATVGSALACALLVPGMNIHTLYWLESVFLAFAFLFPNFVLMLFFIVPIRIKWLALLAWLQLTLQFLSGPWSVRVAILATVLNFLLFFGPSLVAQLKSRQRRVSYQASQRAAKSEPFHECVHCGATDRSHADRVFRYREEDGDARCYCSECLETISQAQGGANGHGAGLGGP